MTAQQLVTEIMARGFQTMSVKQFSWFRSLAAREDSGVRTELINNYLCYEFTTEDGTTVFIDQRYGDFGKARISTMEAK